MAIDPTTGAMASRREQTFECSQLGMFFITGQPSNEARFDGLGQRNGNIVCKPYSSLKTNEYVAMKAAVESGADSRVEIKVNLKSQQIELYDEFTKITSYFPVRDLDQDIRQRLQNAVKAPAPAPSI